MRIVVVSDTHRDLRSLSQLIQEQQESTDFFLHLGDGEREVADVLALHRDIVLYSVRGNCDFSQELPEARVVDAGGVKIFMTHGHMSGVKNSLDNLCSRARAAGAQIALYGHTHAQHYEYQNGLHLMNPGSLSFPRGTARGFGVIEVRDKQILCSLKKLR